MIKRYRQDSVNGMVEDCDYGPYVLNGDHADLLARKDETIHTLQERLSLAHADHTSACSRANEFGKQLDAERSDRTAIQARLNHALDENIGFRGTIIQLERDMKRLANERDEANRTISRERAQATDKIRAQAEEIKRLVGERDTWERDARDACSTLAPVMAERDRLQGEADELRRELFTLKADHDHWKAVATDSVPETEIEQLKQELDMMRRERDTFNERLATAEAEIERRTQAASFANDPNGYTIWLGSNMEAQTTSRMDRSVITVRPRTARGG